ncbi:hypothetical protein [Bradyrhizobium sp. SZCCHNRI2010]|uniref:hypothetical protein n=1 Tax=Bradyrhizobium sp. SZCCHNRI2010 TaxID=3057283 RepID=UPI0028ECF09C|nr:hypothetical protein [Bradyrhizobium sp. SZCCHNRI2010]
MSDVSILHQKFNLEDARLITVSDLVQGTDGAWIRTIRFYGDPVVNGAPTAFIEVQSRSANKDDLSIQAPGFKF